MIGRQPQQGQGIGMPDFVWLNGLAGGNNRYVQDVVASTTQTSAGATPMGAANAQGIEAALVRIKTIANPNDAVGLPQAIAGKTLLVLNATATAATAYASPQVNKVTGVLDTIIGGGVGAAATTAVAANTSVLFYCPVDGTWAKM